MQANNNNNINNHHHPHRASPFIISQFSLRRHQVVLNGSTALSSLAKGMISTQQASCQGSLQVIYKYYLILFI